MFWHCELPTFVSGGIGRQSNTSAFHLIDPSDHIADLLFHRVEIGMRECPLLIIGLIQRFLCIFDCLEVLACWQSCHCRLHE